MEAIIEFDIQYNISKNIIKHKNSKKIVQNCYNKNKCNIVITKKSHNSIVLNKRSYKNKLYIVLTREPNKYIELLNTLKNVLFTDCENINENIIIFPKNYKSINNLINFFKKKSSLSENKRLYNAPNPVCKTLWVTKYKNNSGCDVLFDYKVENKFNEEKVFEKDEFEIYKYTKKLLLT
jgi:hypothetical protein